MGEEGDVWRQVRGLPGGAKQWSRQVRVDKVQHRCVWVQGQEGGGAGQGGERQGLA